MQLQQQFLRFLLRWIVNSFGLWIAFRLLDGHGVQYDTTAGYSPFVWAGLAVSVVNVILKPIAVVLSLPAILLTLGLFTLIVNGLMIWIAAHLVPNLEVGFGAAVLAGIVLSLVNFVLTSLLDNKIWSRGK